MDQGENHQKREELPESALNIIALLVLFNLAALSTIGFLLMRGGIPGFEGSRFSDWALVALTGLYVYVTHRTLLAIHRQIVLSKDTAQRELRAYVGYDGGRVNLDLDAPMVTVYLKNFGHTPAYGFTVVGDIQLAESEDALGEPRPAPIPRGPSDIPPSATTFTQFILERALTEKERWDIEHSVGKTLYVFAQARYRDAFGEQRHTRYRLRVSVVESPRPGDLSATLVFCAGGNESN